MGHIRYVHPPRSPLRRRRCELDGSVPALALGTIGIGACVCSGLLSFGPGWGVVLTFLVGAAISIFDVVESLVAALEVWLYALYAWTQLDASSSSLAGTANVGALLGRSDSGVAATVLFCVQAGPARVSRCDCLRVPCDRRP
jgi:hypothetical protein